MAHFSVKNLNDVARRSFGAGLLVVAITACATRPFKVTSEPAGADVFVSQPGRAARKLGLTPLTASASEVGDHDQTLIVSVEKTGYGRESLVLPAGTFSRTGELQVSLKPVVNGSCANQEESMTKLAHGIAESQSLIHQKGYDAAEQLLNSLAVAYPNLSVIYDLLGNVYYLQRKLDKALAAYKRSNALAADNPETTRMINKISTMNGGKP